MAALLVQLKTHTLDNKIVLEASFSTDQADAAGGADVDSETTEPTKNGEKKRTSKFQ